MKNRNSEIKSNLQLKNLYAVKQRFLEVLAALYSYPETERNIAKDIEWFQKKFVGNKLEEIFKNGLANQSFKKDIDHLIACANVFITTNYMDIPVSHDIVEKGNLTITKDQVIKLSNEQISKRAAEIPAQRSKYRGAPNFGPLVPILAGALVVLYIIAPRKHQKLEAPEYSFHVTGTCLELNPELEAIVNKINVNSLNFVDGKAETVVNMGETEKYKVTFYVTELREDGMEYANFDGVRNGYPYNIGGTTFMIDYERLEETLILTPNNGR